MTLRLLSILLLSSLCLLGCTNNIRSYDYPIAPSEPVSDIYHGDTIVDPYRNFENLEDPAILDWMSKQTQTADSTLNTIPGRIHLIGFQEEYDKENPFETMSTKELANGSYFYLKRLIDEKVFKLYHKSSKDDEETLLFDPQTYTDDQRKNGYTISHHQPSWDGEKVAVSLIKNGNEIGKTIFINVINQSLLPLYASNSAPSLSGGIKWTPDNQSILYIKHKHLDQNSVEYSLDMSTHLYNVEDGTSIDILSQKNNPQLGLAREDFPRIVSFDKNDNFILAQASGSGSFKKTFISPVNDFKEFAWTILFAETDMIRNPLVKGDSLYFMAFANSTKGEICKTSLLKPNFHDPKIVIPEDQDVIIKSYSLTNQGIAFITQRNGILSRLFLERNGKISEIQLPKQAGEISISTQDKFAEELQISYNGWITPGKELRYTIATDVFEENAIDPIIPIPAFKDFIVEEIEIKSHDDVLVPLSLIYNKNLRKDKSNPTLLLNYGAYGASVTPFFFPTILNWVREGGVLAISHVRGGGEKGDAWHKAGFKETKPNSWKDAIACTEYLITQKYTSPEKSAIWGASAGGIIAAMAITERPDLYTAAIFESPAINMLRCEVQPNGPNSIKEFGTVENFSEYKALLEMDAYHNIKKGIQYPAVLIFTGLKDGRVAAWDPAKFIARLQSDGERKNPILLDVEFNSGHTLSNNTDEDIYAAYTKGMSFAFWQMGHPDYQPSKK